MNLLVPTLGAEVHSRYVAPWISGSVESVRSNKSPPPPERQFYFAVTQREPECK